jgi:hypothetical protein
MLALHAGGCPPRRSLRLAVNERLRGCISSTDVEALCRNAKCQIGAPDWPGCVVFAAAAGQTASVDTIVSASVGWRY